MKQPTFETFNEVVDRLIGTAKYARFGKWLEKLTDRLVKLLEMLFENYTPADVDINAEGVKYVFFGVIGIVLLILVYLIIRAIVKKRIKHQKIESILGETIDEASSVMSFREKGELLRLEGKYREAVRMQFIAMLFHLHQNNILYHDKTMTGKEIITTLARKEFKALNSFRELVAQFNFIWYGQKEIEKMQFEKWQNVEKNFWQEVQR